uniref:Extended EGL-27 and MTA1 homology domain n=1 Tax=Siphoviridae sp. ctg4a4 TaxID=2825602 RepID=A0A8S5V5M7_9CAUD|nr:MAG TPA: Extended EGL-27 and MTA1 homology domain [Siphoviridae sp. ctg4a4]DAK51380.1 MAG TPA: Extended EGL-27 and MTA1 homology domain [Caudoviricetes sp.]
MDILDILLHTYDSECWVNVGGNHSFLVIEPLRKL